MKDIAAILLILMIGAMFIMVPVWFMAVSKYFRFLRESHPETYKEMGMPTLLGNNTPSNNISFLRYVCGNKYLATNDNQLIAKSLFLKRFFYLYLAIFVSVIIGVASVGNL